MVEARVNKQPDITSRPLVQRESPAWAIPVEFVFVHSYRSDAPNWSAVMLGDDDRKGRLRVAQDLAAALGVRVVADDKLDHGNHELYRAEGVANLCTALRTRDEVRSALEQSKTGRVLFVSSPDHLPRVVRDALSLGGVHALFASSEISHSQVGAAGVEIVEPAIALGAPS